jgi:outer membrane autotransporter protein
MGCEPYRLSSTGPRLGATSRAGGKFVSSRLLAAIALFTASSVSTHAQTNWTGAFSNGWFNFRNWDAGVPSQTTSANIDTVTPNPTEIRGAGAIAQNLAVGQSGTGMLTILAGGTLTNSFGAVGNLTGSTGTVTVTDPGSSWTNVGSVVVGGLGAGTLTIQNDGTMSSGGGSVGLSAGSTGAVTVTGPGSSWTNGVSNGLNIGSFGAGTLTITSGGRVINITLVAANIGNGAGSQGTVRVAGTGSSWSNRFGVNIGNFGTGTLTIAEGGVVAGPVVIAANAAAIGTLNIGAGAGNPAAAPGTLTAPSIAFGAGTGTINFNHTSTDYVFAPAIGGNGTVNVLAGTTIFTGTNSYSGATNVTAGTLRAGAPSTFSPNSAVTVAGGGTLDLNGFNQSVPTVINAGLVNMGTGTAPGTVLTTTSYTGAGGTIAMNTFLGGDGSPSDKLVINGGSATGNSFLRITNAGGPGAETVANGIVVVQAINGGTTAPGTFSLSGPVEAGAFSYMLFRGSVDASGPQNWYLRSTLNCAVVPDDPACLTPPQPTPPGPVIPDFRPAVPLYAALSPLATQYGFSSLGTLHERMGDPYAMVDPAGGAPAARATPAVYLKAAPPAGPATDSPAIWGRLLGEVGKRDNNSFLSAGPDYTWDFGGLQSGFDLWRREGHDGARDHAGVYGTVGSIGADVQRVFRELGSSAGSIAMQAVSLGGYWTHYGPSGWYVDAVTQGTWYDADARSATGPALHTNGLGWAGSLEGGYPVALAGRLVLEPQAQLIYQRVRFNDGNDADALVSFSDSDALQGRLGARLVKTWDTGALTRPLDTWLRANLWHEFLDGGDTTFAGLTGANAITFAAPLKGTWAEIGGGATGTIAPNTTLFATTAYQHNVDGNHQFAWTGRAGVTMRW